MNVDIIVATYKRYELLQEALRSVMNQSYPHWKCWIAEDGESKETYDAVKPFLNDRRFVYLPGVHAGFPAAPRNRGMRQGCAPYIALLDDDDLWLPKKLEYQVAFLESHPDCVMLGCNAFLCKGTEEMNDDLLQLKKKERLGKIDYNELVNQNCFNCSAVIFRRNIIEKAGLFSETLSPPIGEDYELWLRIGALGEIWNLSEPLVICRETPSTFYSKLNRRDSYSAAVGVYESALNGVGNIPSPLSYPQNAHLAAACRRARDFYFAGPRFLGRFRYGLRSKIKQFFNFSKT